MELVLYWNMYRICGCIFNPQVKHMFVLVELSGLANVCLLDSWIQYVLCDTLTLSTNDSLCSPVVYRCESGNILCFLKMDHSLSDQMWMSQWDANVSVWVLSWGKDWGHSERHFTCCVWFMLTHSLLSLSCLANRLAEQSSCFYGAYDAIFSNAVLVICLDELLNFFSSFLHRSLHISHMDAL